MNKIQSDNPWNNKKSDGTIRLENLQVYYGDNHAVVDVSMEIPEKKITAFIGPSGCGKTVLIKHLIVLLRPSSGEIYFENKRIDNLDEALRQYQLLP